MDVVVTVPYRLWPHWLEEGDCAGDVNTTWQELGRLYIWRMASVKRLPARIVPGDRVYVVAAGKLRGYAPLVRMAMGAVEDRGEIGLLRGFGAVACTILQATPSFQGFRYRWWQREHERPFPNWKDL